ncbi:MAG: tRNA (adenosine(37)-N6)-threonylcarbamoyltransferase complex transferase subunit TsaD [SAR202 cluster bacterium]|nr:tRNA (adenosine(37)-N6)-threonylcarbamoyltransferase complex transferase subunit TsaD [SAR202 cluster bacterium]
MLVLGIESSCDETAAAVVEDGRRALSDVVSSQVAVHARYGGVVPEVASRQHLLSIVPVVEQALQKAEVTMDHIDAVAVTHGPGLVGALMVGVNAAKAIAYARKLPLIGVHHLEAHAYAAWLAYDDPGRDPGFPLVILIASGAHTDLIVMRGHGDYQLVGRTRDDASGEAFDKAARILGLGFPGGPAIQKSAGQRRGEKPMPRAWLHDSLDFSFSGLKTHLLHEAQARGIYPPGDAPADAEAVAQLAGAFQEAVVDVLATKAVQAVERHGARGLVLGGGVSANARLREECARRSPVPVLIPAPRLCTDNGSMVGAAGYYRYMRGIAHGASLDAAPSLAIA